MPAADVIAGHETGWYRETTYSGGSSSSDSGYAYDAVLRRVARGDDPYKKAKEISKSYTPYKRKQSFSISDSRLEEIFQAARAKGPVAVVVKLPGGGEKYFITEGGHSPPVKTIVLYGEEEEQIFRLFRHPHQKSPQIEKIFNELLRKDPEFAQMYFSDPDTVIDIIREKYKDLLFKEAKTLNINTPGITYDWEKKKEEIKKEVSRKVRTNVVGETMGKVLAGKATFDDLVSALNKQLRGETETKAESVTKSTKTGKTRVIVKPAVTSGMPGVALIVGVAVLAVIAGFAVSRVIR